MAIPVKMDDMSIIANNNTPTGAESPTVADDYLRAIQAVVRTTNAQGADILSANTTDIGAATGEFVNVTGTTTITALGTIGAGVVREVVFTGALILTHNASSLILPTAVNITTVAGDVGRFRSLGSGNWKCTFYSSLSKTGGSVTGGLNLARSSIVQNATTMDLFALSNTIDGTGALVTITAIINAPQAGAIRRFYGLIGTILTNNAMFTIDGAANFTFSTGDYVDIEAITTSTYKVHPFKSDGQFILRNYLAGLTLSTAGASATITVATGQASDSTNSSSMTLATIFNKTTSAWAVSNNNGGLDTGAIANATTYHLFLIRRPDTGLIDVLFSLSPTAPTMPASYTQFRRIGAARTTGAAQWIKFIQQDDKFLLDVWVTDISAVNPGIAAVTRTLASVPTGIIVDALMNVYTQNIAAVGAASALISALSISDQAVGSNISNVTASAANAGNTGNPNANISVLTNTSAQVRSRLSFSDASVTLNITTIGWIDSRGRNN